MYVFVDEAKAGGYVVVATVVPRPRRQMIGAELRDLRMRGQRSIHMKTESDSRRRQIVQALAVLDVQAIVYDAGRRYRSERAARQACFARLVADLSSGGVQTEIVLDRDDTLVSFDNQHLLEAVRRSDCRDRLTYRHSKAAQDPLLSISDVVAWCWPKRREWRPRVQPIIQQVIEV